MDFGQYYDDLEERDDLSEMMQSDTASKQKYTKSGTMGEKKQNTLEEIDERDDDESLAYTNDSVSLAGSINFRLT